MQFNSVKRGNFSGLAKATNRAMDTAFNAARTTAVDNTAIAKESIKGRGLERRAAMKAEADVAQAGLKAATDVKLTEIKIDAAESVRKSKASAKRMAGMVAGLGAITGAVVQMEGNKKDKAERDADRAYEQDVFDRTRALLQDTAKQSADLRKQLEEGLTTPTTDNPSAGDSSVISSASTNNSSSKPKPVSANISANHSASPNTLSRKQITDYAIGAGFTPEQANIVYGIAGGESGFDPTNSTERSGLKARTGEDSVGLMQINWGYHKDKGWLQGLGINSREDLFDPQKNMKAAKYLFDGRGGGFQDWTVFNKGIYKNYL